MSEYTTVAKVEDIQPGEMRLFKIGDEEVIVAHSTYESFHAFDSKCPHAYQPLIDGELRGQTIACVYHRIVFKMTDGSVTFGASGPLKLYEVRVEGDEIQVGPRKPPPPSRWGNR